MRIVDDDGFDVPQGEPGEIVIRGDACFNEYYNRPEANQKSIDWLLGLIVDVCRHESDICGCWRSSPLEQGGGSGGVYL